MSRAGQMRGAGLAVLAAIALVGISCAPLNSKLPKDRYPTKSGDGPVAGVTGAPRNGYRFTNLAGGRDDNRLFVCLTFSGGGTRAAALAYGAMIALRQTKIKWPREETLLDEVDCISSVSGGSFTAAYYGLFGERLFQDFEQKMLYRDIEGGLILKGMAPWNWPWLWSPYYSRIDLAANYYDDTIYEHKKYRALIEHGRRPFIILNATNIGNESRFPFTQEQFDLLGSDLSDYSVARAVAASSVFPFLLCLLTLENYQHLDGFTIPTVYQVARDDYYLNRSQYHWAQSEREYVEYPMPYVHLLDGGLADNIGLRPVINAYEQTNGFIMRNLPEIDRLVIISVNARTKGEDPSGNGRHTPYIIPTVALATADTAMDNYSFDSVDLMNRLVDEIRQAEKEQQSAGIRSSVHAVPYAIEISFEAIANKDRRREFYGIGTNFGLPAEQVRALISEGCELLKNDATFRCMLEDLERDGRGTATTESACNDLTVDHHPAAADGIVCPAGGGWPAG